MLPYDFHPFSLIERVLRKIQEDRVTAILITPTWQLQSWYPWLLKMSIKNPILLPPKNTLLMNPQGTTRPLIRSRSLRLVAWLTSSNTEGISEKAAKLITNARRAGTQACYESAWNKWDSW